MDPICLLTPQQPRFFSPGLVHIMTYCNNLHERTNPIEIFFSSDTPYPDSTDRTLHRIPMPCSPNHLTYAFQPAPLDLSLGSFKKKSPSVFFRSPPRSSSFGESLCFYQHPSPSPIHPPNGKNSISRLLCALSVFVQYTLSLLNTSFFVLRSAFFSESQKWTLITPAPPHVGLCFMRACGWRFGLGSDSLDQSTAHFFLHPYYIICLLLAIVCT
jgi:hypothetical protein